MADELIDILSSEGIAMGEVKLKSEAHKKGLWHASVQIWFYTPNGEILLQKRAKNKDTYPNLWDISVAGHLSVGDTAVNAALREIEEEIGLRVIAKELHFLKIIKNSKFLTKNIIDNEFNYLYIIEYPIVLEELVLQIEEVSEVKLFTISKFKEELLKFPKKYVPHSEAYYSYIIKKIEHYLKK